MARQITIRFPSDRTNDFYFRVFCWADDTLYPAIVAPGWGEIVDLDSVRDVVRIELKRHRQLKAVVELIDRTLPKHFPDCEPIVEVT